MIIITNDKVHAATNPMTMPIVLFSSRSDRARVGMSPNLLGVAMPPTCPRRVDIIAFWREIFSMCDVAHCHFIDSESILHGINSTHMARYIQLEDIFDENCLNREG